MSPGAAQVPVMESGFIAIVVDWMGSQGVQLTEQQGPQLAEPGD